jgi:hypothetical protein
MPKGPPSAGNIAPVIMRASPEARKKSVQILGISYREWISLELAQEELYCGIFAARTASTESPVAV